MTRRQRIVEQVSDERERQIEKGWTPEHDDQHGAEHLIELAADRLAGPCDRPELIEAGALIVAAIECGDRL